MEIPFNKPYSTGKEINYISDVISRSKLSGDGIYTKKCHQFFENKYGFEKVLLTTSCTDALEMAAILLDIKEGDEVIAPSYTFVSTVNPFILRGAKVVFADSNAENPNMDISTIEGLITSKTKIIIAVHYAGIACDMGKIIELANKYNLFIVEDAALSIDSYYKDKPLGKSGHLAAFSFHETKNIISGEGGMLVINDNRFVKRAEIIREKGTNRSAFFRGEIDKYGWIDIGSSFLPSEITAAFLFAQLEAMDEIQNKRKQIWNLYFNELLELQEKEVVRLPFIPKFATNNASTFYLVCKNLQERTDLISVLAKKGIASSFHYLSLHKSAFYIDKHDGRDLEMADNYSDCLLRLPLFYELTEGQIKKITTIIKDFYYNINK